MAQASPPAGTPFATWLRQRRKALDLTQEQLAAAIDVSLPTIAKIEAGQRRPSRQVAELLAHCLEVPPEEQAEFMRMARAPLDGGTPDSQPSAAAAGLPAPLDRLIGRQEELAQLARLLTDDRNRLLTLTGPGGVGKTRLAIALAWQVLDEFPDGVHFVSLAPLRDPALVLDAIARSLGLREAAGSLSGRLAEHLAGRQVLLVLDNFEHLLAAAPAVADLVAACPTLRVLATSRECLRLRGEHRFAVPPLPLPDLACLPALDCLSASHAVALFIDRACEARPEFALNQAAAEAVAAICVRFDGLPLAIELAAARMDLFTPAALLAGMDSRLAIAADPAAAPRDLPARQRTLAAAIRWSYDLLDPGEQTLFARLAVFAGGFTLNAADAVCNALGDLPFAVAEGLGSLMRKSLLVAVQSEDDPAPESRRLLMLETLREYASERLAESGQASETFRGHVEYFLALAETASSDVLSGPEQGLWMHRLDEEHNNIRAALSWSLAGGAATAGLALSLGAALGSFWEMRGYLREGRRWIEQAIQNAANVAGRAAGLAAIRPAIRARAFATAGRLSACQADLAASCTFYLQALAAAEEAGDRPLIARCYMGLGVSMAMLGNVAEGRDWSERALALIRALDDPGGLARFLDNLGLVLDVAKEWEQARAAYEESLALHRQIGDRYGTAHCVGNLGSNYLQMGDYARARELLAESLAMRQEMGDKRGVAFCLVLLGLLALEQSRWTEALDLYTRGLKLGQELGERNNIAICLSSIARVCLGLGQPYPAACLLGATSAVSQGIHDYTGLYQAQFDQAVARVRAQLGDAAFDQAWAQGAAWPLAQAIAYALEAPADTGSAPAVI